MTPTAQSMSKATKITQNIALSRLVYSGGSRIRLLIFLNYSGAPYFQSKPSTLHRSAGAISDTG